MTRTQSGDGPLEVDGVLAMVRLLGKAPEDFADRSAEAGRLKQGRLDTTALHAALDERRRTRGLRWTDVASEIGIGTAGTLQRLAKGGRTTIDVALACTWWLGYQVDDFVDPGFRHPGERGRATSP